MDKPYDYLFKLLMIGDSGVGKTCVLYRFCDETFSSAFISTIGIDFKIKTVEIGDKKIKMQIWDTAGQERFKTITTAYYRGAMGIIVVFDVTNEKSFENVSNWIQNINDNASPDVEKVLLGNKCDMEEHRVVSNKRAQEVAEGYSMHYFDVSARSDINITSAFMTLVEEIKLKMDNKISTSVNERINNNNPVSLNSNTKEKSGCC